MTTNYLRSTTPDTDQLDLLRPGSTRLGDLPDPAARLASLKVCALICYLKTRQSSTFIVPPPLLRKLPLEMSSQTSYHWRLNAGAGGGAPNCDWAPKFSRTLDKLCSHCGQLILRKKISKFDATICQILRLKYTKFDFRWGSAPDPAGGAYNAPSGVLLKMEVGIRKGAWQRA